MFVYLKVTVTEWKQKRGRENMRIFNLLFHSPNDHISQGLDPQIQDPEVTPLVSHMSAGSKGPGLLFAAFPGILAGSWIERGAAGSGTSAIRDAGTAGGSFSCFATVLACFMLLMKT